MDYGRGPQVELLHPSHVDQPEEFTQPHPSRASNKEPHVLAGSKGSSSRETFSPAMKLFVDNTRFWSMFAIVAVHCIQSASTGSSPSDSQTAELVQDVLKFGTIDFFLISGFLLGHRFETGSKRAFLRRRLAKIFIPWLFWFVLWLAMTLSHMIRKHEIAVAFDSTRILEVGSIAAHSVYWFVPNLLLSTCALLLLRRHLRSYWLGAALLTVPTFYATNLYFEWIPTSHTTAIGGYIFFLWLGHVAAEHYAWITRLLDRLTMQRMLLITSSLLLLSILESVLLRKVSSADPANTLRLSNQLYSISVALLLLKGGSRTWPEFINVRKNLFGVYLVHVFVLSFSQAVLSRLHLLYEEQSLSEALTKGSLLALFVFISSVIFTQFLSRRPKFAWIVGGVSSAAAPSRAEHC